MNRCECRELHTPRRIVLTGGPGAGKTAVLALIRQSFCQHVRVLAEAATIVFGGGFPRESAVAARRATQRAIFYVQRELEAAAASDDLTVILCDRGTVDGVAYWPGPDELWSEVGTTLEEQLARYHAVIHLRTPSADRGYNHQNAVRTESAEEARALDERISQAWAGHPRRFIVDSDPDFLAKAARVLTILRGELPECCRDHVVPQLAAYEKR